MTVEQYLNSLSNEFIQQAAIELSAWWLTGTIAKNSNVKKFATHLIENYQFSNVIDMNNRTCSILEREIICRVARNEIK